MPAMEGCPVGQQGEQGVVTVGVRRLDPGLPVPSYAHASDAGADLRAATDVTLAPGARSLVPTGIAIELPVGYVGLVHPRSGLASRLGVTVLNAPGTVDSGYRGEIMVNLVNHDPVAAATIARGDRIAQLVVQRVERADFCVVEELSASTRGTGGHGSTGGHAGLPTAGGTGSVGLTGAAVRTGSAGPADEGGARPEGRGHPDGGGHQGATAHGAPVANGAPGGHDAAVGREMR
jgi:dUTP pyrophosphatase